MEGVDYVIHTAALKHVPVCEYNPIEAIKTNVDGAINVIDCAIDCQVKRVINISSDKAVNPINLYGATKLASEKLFIYSNIYGKDRTFFSCIRFGNFWGSKGSVIPLWETQKQKGSITVTEGGMKRYWIKIEDACKFTKKVLDLMQGGEIFIPYMNTLSMDKLANKIAPDSYRVVTGKRKGEKFMEELYSEDEQPIFLEGYMVIK